MLGFRTRPKTSSANTLDRGTSPVSHAFLLSTFRFRARFCCGSVRGAYTREWASGSSISSTTTTHGMCRTSWQAHASESSSTRHGVNSAANSYWSFDDEIPPFIHCLVVCSLFDRGGGQFCASSNRRGNRDPHGRS